MSGFRGCSQMKQKPLWLTLTRGTGNIKVAAKNFEPIKTKTRVTAIAVWNAGANKK